MFYFPNILYGKEADVSIIEKKIDFPNDELKSSNKLDNLYQNDETDTKKKSEENLGTVIVTSKSYLCKLEEKSLELACTNQYLCQESNCSRIMSFSDIYVQGNSKSISTTYLNSDPLLKFSKIRFNSGEFDIRPHYNQILTDICKEIKPDIFSFESFSVGNLIPQHPKSILCVNIGNECYGIIAEGETKFCQITKVIIKDYNKS